ncbi:hypothetical protein UPYG_G00149680 [Umbra pygmaea]|uniref:Tyrosyl-DNA phosphodiesterase 2 n=1 Tax=Umbra pygmaea TaxID=75934 RepID=A0ABD0X0V5_UMBPY
MGRKRKNGRKVRSAEKMEDKNEETESVYVPMQSVQVQSIPVESVSVESVSVESVPVKSVSVESVQVGSVPVESVSVESVSVESVSVESVSVESVSVESVQVGSVPVESVPVESVPVESVPVESVPVESVPVESVSVESVSVESVSVESVPVKSVSVESVQVGSVPVESVPVESVPVESVLVESVSVESVSVESVSVESVPVQFSPVESAPVESVLVESVPVHSVPIQPQSKECYPAPSTGQTDQDKHMPEQTIPKQPEQHKPAQLNPAYPSADQHNQARIPSALPSQTPPEHPYLAKLPIPPTTQSEDQPSPDQGSPLRFSPDQPSLDQSPLSSPDEDKPKKKGDANKLSVLTWNIDCLDLDNIKERVSRLLDYLIEYHPDIVLLQEVIFPVYQVLQQVLKPYHVLSGSDRNYFTAILLRKSRVQLLEGSIVNYPSTNMRRNLLMAKIVFLGHSLCVMTSHLESMKSGGSERQNQLRILWDKMMEQPQDHNVIFGGDTNLRDWEVKNLGGLPEGICDVWEYLGQPEDCRYTWDCVTNDNKEIAFPARLRFDRLFFKQAGKGSKVIPDGLTLVGQERLANSDQFTSDHWGLLSSFILEPFSHPE